LGGQHKVPRLSNERNFVDEISEFILDQSGETNTTSQTA
jgi:hypothetical protein